MDSWEAVREDIKARLPVEDLVGGYVDLKRSGVNYKGLCPFHQEKTPSFIVSPSRGTYHCFGCQKGGTIFDFIMEMEHVSFPDALKRLAERTGVSLPERESRQPSLKGKLYDANSEALTFFRRALGSGEGKRAVDYLFERGFGPDAADRFDLGYAPRSRDDLVRHMRKAGIEDRLILGAGLAIEGDGDSGLRDRFRGRLIFPIRDTSGRVTGFGGRVLGEGTPKYLNSPQTEIFDKSGALFGIHLAQDAIRQSGKAVLVEGYLDAVRAQLGGYLHTVASLGTAVTAQQLATLGRLSGTAVLALDPDPAGQSAAARTSIMALMEVTAARGRSPGASSALDLRIAQLPPSSGDPDDVIRDDPATWEQAIEDSVPAFEFYFTRVIESLDHSSESWRQAAIDQLLPLIKRFSASPGWQAIWIERLAGETGVDARALQGAMPRGREARPTRRPERQDVVSRTTARALTSDLIGEVEQSLLALLLQVLVVPTDAADVLADVELDNPDHRLLLERVLHWQNYDYELFHRSLPEELQPLADQLRGRSVPLPSDGKFSVAIQMLLTRREQVRLQLQLHHATQVLQTMTSEDQAETTAGIAALTDEKREIDERLRQLQQRAIQTHHGTIDQDLGSS